MVFVCPKPPFHPCTATTVVPVLMISSSKADRRPNRIRLSTYEYGKKTLSSQGTLQYDINATYISLPLMNLDSSGLRIPERINATMQVNLTRSLLVSRNCSHPIRTISYILLSNHGHTTDNRHIRTVLGQEPGSVATRR